MQPWNPETEVDPRRRCCLHVCVAAWRQLAIALVAGGFVGYLVLGVAAAGGTTTDDPPAIHSADNPSNWPVVTHTPWPDLPEQVGVVDHTGAFQGYIPRDDNFGPYATHRADVSLPSLTPVRPGERRTYPFGANGEVTGTPVHMNDDLTGYMVYWFGFVDVAIIKDTHRFNKLMGCYFTAEETRDATAACERTLVAEGLGDYLHELRSTSEPHYDFSPNRPVTLQS